MNFTNFVGLGLKLTHTNFQVFWTSRSGLDEASKFATQKSAHAKVMDFNVANFEASFKPLVDVQMI